MGEQQIEGLIGNIMNKTDETLQTELQKIVSTEAPVGISAYSIQDPQDSIEIVDGFSELQELMQKVDLCLKKQQRLRFVIKEIADIVKKSS